MRRSARSLCLAAVALAGCSRSDAKSLSWSGNTDTLPNGVVHVTNAAEGMWGASGAPRITELVRIGTEGAEGPESFADVRAIEVDSRGRIYVLEAEAQEIRVFDSAGAYVRTIGRKGAGPGELKDAIGMFWDGKGRLWVVDQANARFTAFDTAGNYISDRRRLFANHMTWVWSGRYLDDGRLVEWLPGETMDQPARLILLDPTSFVARDTFPLPHFSGNYFEIREKHRGIRASVPFSPGLSWTLDGRGYVWFGSQDRYRLFKRRLEGDTVKIIEKPFTPLPVSSAEKDTALARLEWFTQQGGTIAASRIPDYKPAFSSLFVDERGNLWVAPVVEGEGDRWFDYFDDEGHYRGRIDLGFTLAGQAPLIRGKAIYAISRDSLGVPYVVRARIGEQTGFTQ